MTERLTGPHDRPRHIVGEKGKVNLMDEAEHLAFIDLEASSLGSSSFPTEIGWATILVTEHRVVSGGCLVKPTSNWLRASNAWSPASERITGISLDLLDREVVAGRRYPTLN